MDLIELEIGRNLGNIIEIYKLKKRADKRQGDRSTCSPNYTNKGILIPKKKHFETKSSERYYKIKNDLYFKD